MNAHWPAPAKAGIRSMDASAPNGMFQPLFSGWRKVANLIAIGIWIAALVYFWSWWFQPAHVYTIGRYLIVTGILLWVTVIPAYFVFIFARARIPIDDPCAHSDRRVAVVVTKTPSEPFALVEKTLEGALAQNGVVHDTWLADEDPDEETLSWCARHGVDVSCRKNATDYHRDTWPRRNKSKEGNLAYFYDHFGYDRYEFVAQFDADHVPSTDYLKHALAPFADPAVGYVSAPSICDSNADKSWSARGRLYIEASMHGALQTGYNAGWAPLCIGSHYTVRTAALRSIGGLGPELAEDHSTTLMLNAQGWRGVHAVDAIAHGEGPEEFTDFIVQEFQWARSLVTILLRYTPSRLARLSARLRFQFVFSELWYPMFSTAMATMFILPIIALVSGKHFVNVSYIGFFFHILPLSAALLGMAYWWRSTGIFRPANAKVLSWEGLAFLYARWPWSLLGSLAAVWDIVSGTHATFRVTPKTGRHTEPIPFRALLPYLAVAIASAGCALAVKDPGSAAGFYIFCLVNAIGNLLIVGLILYRHSRENGVPLIPSRLPGAAVMASVATILALTVGATYENGPKGLAAIDAGIRVFTLTRTVYSPTGAGKHATGKVRFSPRWRGFSSSHE